MKYKDNIYIDFYKKNPTIRKLKISSFIQYYYKYKRDLNFIRDILSAKKKTGYNMIGYRKYNKQQVIEYFQKYGARETSNKLKIPLKTVYRYNKEYLGNHGIKNIN